MNRLYALLPPSASDATTLRIVDLFLGKKTEGWEKSSCDELKALKIFLLFYCSGTRAHKANKTRDVKKGILYNKSISNLEIHQDRQI